MTAKVIQVIADYLYDSVEKTTLFNTKVSKSAEQTHTNARLMPPGRGGSPGIHPPAKVILPHNCIKSKQLDVMQKVEAASAHKRIWT